LECFVLNVIDRLEVHVVIDNVTDSHSSIPSHAESEFSYLQRQGLEELDGDRLCCACHGYACLVTATVGDERRSVLFDAGPEGYAFDRNVRRLGIDLGVVEAVVLSHGHWDHAGGMLTALDLIRHRKPNHRVPYYAHPGMFRSRGRYMANGRVLRSKDVPRLDALESHGAEVIATDLDQTILAGALYLSGEIPRVTSFERGFPGHVRRTLDDSGWESDELILDERFLAAHVAGKGLVILTACSHAGVVNVLHHARARFPDAPPYAVLGGFHLAGANEKIIPQTTEALKEFRLSVVGAGHCTGWRAINHLERALGGAVDPSAVGKRYVF
jgi:7,8-dihydropterin-6-yl-methyl-4-(beta-D-ribofuranosyl)aminobenzene 5'-phosphate synthase